MQIVVYAATAVPAHTGASLIAEPCAPWRHTMHVAFLFQIHSLNWNAFYQKITDMHKSISL